MFYQFLIRHGMMKQFFPSDDICMAVNGVIYSFNHHISLKEIEIENGNGSFGRIFMFHGFLIEEKSKWPPRHTIMHGVSKM